MKLLNTILRTIINNACSSAFIFISMTAMILVLDSCSKSNSDTLIPNVPVNLTIQLSLPAYSNLNSVGGSVEIPSYGYRGIVVYRSSIDAFVAFDMACSYDPADNAAILHVDSTGINVVDNHCGSKFSLAGGGAIIKGPATRPMKQYNTVTDLGNNTVAVYN